MDINTVSHNPLAPFDSWIAHERSRPTDAIFNHRTLLLLSTPPSLLPGASRSDDELSALQLTRGIVQEASPFGTFLPDPQLSRPLSNNSQPSLVLEQATPNSLSQDQIRDLLEMGTSNAFFILFQHGHLLTLVVGGYHILECPHCSQSVKTSIPSTCRNVPVVCPLCPLPPCARQTNWQDGVWRYNMEQHLNFYHSEYAHPGKVSGLPLPREVATATLLDPREEEKFGVPQCPTFTNIIEKDMEGMSAGEKRRSANANAFAAGAAGGKCTCHSK